MSIKGELFSTDMVKAFLENRKSRTSRPIKDGITVLEKEKMYVRSYAELVDPKVLNDANGNFFFTQQHPEGGYTFTIECKPKYQPGDIMYVRETWRIHNLNEPAFCMMIDYKADNHTELQIEFEPSRFDKFKKYFKKSGWISSKFMPKEAARLFFRVSDVKAQRLENTTEQDAVEDGFISGAVFTFDGTDYTGLCARDQFMEFWAKQYGADANWIWGYVLKKISKEEALNAKK